MASFVQALDREAVFAALWAIVSGAYAWKNDLANGRRLKLWGEVPVEQRPALFQFEGTTEAYTYSQSPTPKRRLEAALYVYIDAADKTIAGTVQLNALMLALETALLPQISDRAGGMGERNTLGGLVHSCRIEGNVFRDPGDLDGDGMLKLPIVIIGP